MPQVGFEPTIPVFERAKTVHALDRAATMIGFIAYAHRQIILEWSVEEDEMERGCSTHGEKRKVYRVSVGIPERKRPLTEFWRRCEDNVKMDLRRNRTAWCGVNSSGWDRDQQRAVVNTVMNLPVPQNVGKLLCSWVTGGFSRRAQLREVSWF
jgi:hypothetical protein